MGHLDLRTRLGLITEPEDVDFIRYMSLVLPHNTVSVTQEQKNKINELYARYGAKP